MSCRTPSISVHCSFTLWTHRLKLGRLENKSFDIMLWNFGKLHFHSETAKTWRILDLNTFIAKFKFEWIYFKANIIKIENKLKMKLELLMWRKIWNKQCYKCYKSRWENIFIFLKTFWSKMCKSTWSILGVNWKRKHFSE